MTIELLLSIIATTASFIAIPASGYLSYRYAIKGERRKEFNNIADPLREKFRGQLSFLEENIYPANGKEEVTEQEFFKLMDVTRKCKKEKLSTCWHSYNESLASCGTRDKYGDYEMHDSNDVIQKINDLMPFIERQ